MTSVRFIPLFALSGVLPAQRPEAEKLIVAEHILARDLEGHQLVQSSYDNTAVAWWQQKGGKFRVFVNGKPSPWKPGRPPRFLRDPALVSCLEDTSYLGVDGKPHHDYELANTFQFSRVGGRVAYQYDHGGKRHAVVATNGRHGVVATFDVPPHDDDDATHVQFSPDGKRYALPVFRKGKWHIVVDGEWGPGYEHAGFPEFSANSQRYQYGATVGDSARTIVDGKRVVGAFFGFTAAGARVIEWRGGSGDRSLFVGGQATGLAGYDAFASVTVRPSDGALGGVARKGRVVWWFLGEQKSEPILLAAKQTARVQFSPKFDHVAVYLSRDNERTGRVIRIRDGAEILRLDAGEHFGFDPTGATILYGHAKALHLRDLGTGRTKALPGAHTWDFSKSGKRIAFESRQTEAEPWWFQYRVQRMVEPDRRYANVSEFVFGPDERHYAYWAERAGKCYAIVDGEEVGPFDLVPSQFTGTTLGVRGSGLTFVNSKLLRAHAIRKQSVVRLEITIAR